MAATTNRAGRREKLRAYAAAKPGATQNYPWNEDLVYKVGGKVFVFLGSPERQPAAIVVSCGPDAAEWRARYPASVSAAPYLGRHGWNAVLVDADVPPEELRELIDASYDRVVAALPRSRRP